MSQYIYSEEDVQKVREANDITDVIAEYIHLKRAGANYKALCPFHNEKTPSFMVSPSKQIFNCFGCGEGGDVLGFVMKHSNLGFVEAVELLAERVGIYLEKNMSQDNYEEIKNTRNVLYELNKDAAKYFHNNLMQNEEALNYISNRGIDSGTIRGFGLGYSNDEWQSLYNYLKSRGHQEAEMEELGLIIKKKSNNGYYDRFRNRIMYPIIDVKGKVIGFGGRVLDNSQPKYLNSPDSSIFSKGNNLYGLNKTKKYTRSSSVILVEGYMDVISLFNHGIKGSAASLGTAFTTHQAKLLKRYSNEYYICYDSDDAGLRAADKALDIFKGMDIKAKVIVLPEGKDPDDYILENGMDAFQARIKAGLDYMDFKIHLYKQKYDLSSTEGSINFTKEISNLLKGINSAIEIDAYINNISEETNISVEAIKQEVLSNATGKFNQKTNTKDKYIYDKYRHNNIDRIIPVKHNLEPGHLKAEKNLLKLIIFDKEIYMKIKDRFTPTSFFNETHRRIASITYQAYEEGKELNANITDHFDGKELEIINLILSLDIPLEDQEKIKAVEDYIKKIEIHKLKIRKNNIRTKIKLLEENYQNDEEKNSELKELKVELSRLDKELRSHH